MLERKKFKWPALWLGIGWLLVATIVVLSLIPAPDIDIPGGYGDKYGHIIAYAALMFWFAQIYAERGPRAVLALAFALLGIGLEFAQALTDYRTFDQADMLANVIGIAAGWLIGPPRTFNLIERIESAVSF